MKDKTKGFWAEFKKFISKGNVVDMAVGVAVATAFTAIVTAFTKGFIAPIISLLSHDASLSDMKWVIRPEEAEVAADGTKTILTPEVAILWGSFLQSIIDFLIIAFVMFIFLKIVMSGRAKTKSVQKRRRKPKPKRKRKRKPQRKQKPQQKLNSPQKRQEKRESLNCLNRLRLLSRSRNNGKLHFLYDLRWENPFLKGI